MTPDPATRNERDDELANSIIDHFMKLNSDRSTFAQHWEEVAALVRPTSVNTFMFGNSNTPGQKNTQQQVDATAMLALSRFGAILDSLLTPRNQQWHTLEPSNRELMKDRASRLWFEEATRILFKLRYSHLSNFASQNQQNYQELGAFGTGGVFLDKYEGPGGETGFRYKAIPLGELFIIENHQGLVDGFIRWFRLNAKQAYDQFGDMIPEQLQTALKAKSQANFDFLHYVAPNKDYNEEKLDYRGKLFKSCYVSMAGRKLLTEGGYNSLPLAASRYDQAPGEAYGRSPAMMVLPAIKTLNAEKATFLAQGHRAAAPILLTADDGLLDINMRPGAVNKGGWSAEGRPLVGTLPTGNIQTTKEMMDEERALINDAFLVTLFQILTETPAMTATEVVERTNEKGILLAPTVGRQQSEYLGPLIYRELDLASELGLLPEMPPLLREANGEYEVVYTSPLSRSMRAQEASGALRTIETVIGIVNVTQDPSLLDNFDFDVAIPELAHINAVPERWMASPEMKQQKRDSRQKELEDQKRIQAAPAAAAMMKAQQEAQSAAPA